MCDCVCCVSGGRGPVKCFESYACVAAKKAADNAADVWSMCIGSLKEVRVRFAKLVNLHLL